MIRNYIKIALRNLLKYKFISLINLFGLTVGLSCCLLILSYIINELSYDKYNKKAERIYRVSRAFYKQDGGLALHLGSIAPPYGPLFKNDFPDIEKVTRLLPNGNTPLKYGEKLFNEKNVYFADENLFDVFDVTITAGNAKEALLNPFSVMLTEETARKYFGNENPINKVITFANQYPLKVTGVYKKFPANSHMHPEMLFSFNTLKDTSIYGERKLQTNWGNNSFYTYLLLPENYPIEKIEAQFPAFIDKHMTDAGYPAGTKPSSGTKLFIQKLTDIHLRSHLDSEVEENGDISRVYIFSAIALFILLIACINYMNLSTARSVLRAKEIGIRKVVGAERKEIITQFLCESVLLTTIALALALLFMRIALPFLNELSGQELSVAPLNKWYIVIPVLLTPVVVGTLSGLYPALFMSSFKPITVLKGIFKISHSQFSFRKVLVVVQFAISIILIISTAIVLKQLRYLQAKDLGYNKDHIITIPYTAALNTAFETFKNTLIQNTTIKNVALSSRIPTGRLLDAMGTRTYQGDSATPLNADIKFLFTDYDFIPTYGIEMAAGRNFSRSYGTDTAGFIINQTAAKVLGCKTAADALGKDILYGNNKGRIIGVIKDFHFESLHQKMASLIFLLPSPGVNPYNRITIKVSGENMPGTLRHIEQTWRRMLPEVPYEYTFLDENFERLYKAEQRQASVFTIFSFIAIFIACLGLFGLSAFTITQRIKEIGIRKVLGATIAGIVGMLSKDFIKLVGVAAVIAFPVAWYSMHNWLEDFAYRISIPWWIFIVAGIVAAIIALATISIQAVKAAVANPVSSLRAE